MKIFTKIVSKNASMPSEVLTIALNYDDRKRGRIKVNLSDGEPVGIQIERGQVLRHGTYLTTDEIAEKAFLYVRASKEAVSKACIENATLFARACYHLGNRHVPLQIGTNFLQYQADYVLDDMLKGMGVKVSRDMEIFEPENGAYKATSHTHSYDESHSKKPLASKTHGHHH